MHLSICNLLTWGTTVNNAEPLILQVSMTMVHEGPQGICGRVELLGHVCTSSTSLGIAIFLLSIYSHQQMLTELPRPH